LTRVAQEDRDPCIFREVPLLKPYDFAMVQKKIVIVNPSDKKIVEVITR
jgi:hypothetical protein